MLSFEAKRTRHNVVYPIRGLFWPDVPVPFCPIRLREAMYDQQG